LPDVRTGKKYSERGKGFRGIVASPISIAALSLLLIILTGPWDVPISVVLLTVSVPIYTFFSPKKELSVAKEVFLSTEAVLARAAA